MVISEEENMTVIRSPLVAAEIDVLRLNLRYRKKSVTLEEPMPEIVLGRQDICALAIDSSYASRRPATIQAVRGIVFLKDHSPNRTYVRWPAGQLAFVNRELVQFHGAVALFLRLV